MQSRRASHGSHAPPVTSCRGGGPPLGPFWKSASDLVIDTVGICHAITNYPCAIHLVDLSNLLSCLFDGHRNQHGPLSAVPKVLVQSFNRT